MIHHGDCLEVVAGMESESVDAIVTDPPYGLGFMCKEWDALPPGLPWAEQCLRVLKPGGHLLAFGGSRTFHRLAVAVEDAGFEIRDQIMWLYGSGFPKSLDVSKAIDKAQGAEGEYGEPKSAAHAGWIDRGAMRGSEGHDGYQRPWMKDPDAVDNAARKYLPGSPDARRWSGWGTALKPAHEPVVVARKPLIGTVAQNVERFGVGGLNIDGCRVGADGGTKVVDFGETRGDKYGGGKGKPTNAIKTLNAGRWPANLILDEVAGAVLDGQSGELHSQDPETRMHGQKSPVTGSTPFTTGKTPVAYSDKGGASRFFYTAKAGRCERNAGLDGFEERIGGVRSETSGQHITRRDGGDPGLTKNHHPTVKPIDVMRWLVRLVTPPGGTVLDPFTGSGTTGIAAGLEGFDFIGIEREAEYLAIAEARIAWWGDKHGDTADILVANGLAEKAKAEHVERGQLDLLGEAA